jgi:hypothetical protein
MEEDHALLQSLVSDSHPHIPLRVDSNYGISTIPTGAKQEALGVTGGLRDPPEKSMTQPNPTHSTSLNRFSAYI